MIKFILNDKTRTVVDGDSLSLLAYLRDREGLTSAKDGCSGQAACGACLVELNGRPVLSCVTPLRKVTGGRVVTLEGLSEPLRRTLGRAFVEKGAIQCGFCTPGFLMRTKILLQVNPHPSREEIVAALKFNLCRCTGYVKIIEAIETAARILATSEAPPEFPNLECAGSGIIGNAHPKYGAMDLALGRRPFVDDLKLPGLLHGALKFSEWPRARITRIDSTAAAAASGVIRVFTAADVPAMRHCGLIVADWPLLVSVGETTASVADVLALVVAVSEPEARAAADLVRIEAEPLEALLDARQAEESAILIHERGNLLEACRIRRGGDVEAILSASAHVARGIFETQRVEHAYLETEAAVALPDSDDGIRLYSQGQGIYEDRRQVAALLGLPVEKVRVTLVDCGGGFGGKEDMTVQGHAALAAHLLRRPVKVKLNRPESIRMHPKRHPFTMEYALGCDALGRLTALRARIVGDTGAYASVGGKVLERAAGHASGAYHVPAADIEAKALYTNNLPSGAMRGFGVNQVTFAMESCMDMLCEKGGFDRWQFRYDNALDEGRLTATGQRLGRGVGVRPTLLAVREAFARAEVAGIACGIKNTGIGNAMVDESRVRIEIASATEVVIHHGWTEMGQGVHTVAVQTLCQETGLDPACVRVSVDTGADMPCGMTTASRASTLLGNALIDACRGLNRDLRDGDLAALAGRTYEGRWACDWTTKPGAVEKPETHYSYGYATQVVILDSRGEVSAVIAAHDAGRILNRSLFEGQIQGAVVMGLGYALSEDLQLANGKPKSFRLADCGLLRAEDVPVIEVIPVEVADPCGPYGAKGVGEIGLVPTAAAVANALWRFDGVRRFRLPLKKKKG